MSNVECRMMDSLRSVFLYGQNTLFDAYSPPLEDSILDVRWLQSAFGGFDVH